MEALPPGRNVDYKTLQTYLRRLHAKGYLAARREGRSTFFTPSARPGQVIRETVADFVNRLFGGEPVPLLEHLIREQPLSSEEVRKLRQLLDEWEAEHERPA